MAWQQRRRPRHRRAPPSVAAASDAVSGGKLSADQPRGRAAGVGGNNGGAVGIGGGGRHGGDIALPVRLVKLPGKGHGVVAARNLQPGELLLLCRPLALVRGPAPGPSVAAAAAMAACSEEALVAELQRLPWGPRQAAILATLFRGASDTPPPPRPPSSAAAAVAAAATRPPPDLSELADPWDADAALGTAGLAAAAAAAPQPTAAAPRGPTRGSAPAGGLVPEQLMSAVRLNATRLPSDDVLLAQLYGTQNMPYIGLWPAHAMVNHSCTCARCVAEERVPRDLSQLWTDIVTLTSQQLQPKLMAAAAALRTSGPAPAPASGAAAAIAPVPAAAGSPATLQQLLDVCSQAAKCCDLFEDTLRQLGKQPQEALWLQASMYPLYETRARCALLLASASAATERPPQGAAAGAGEDAANADAGAGEDARRRLWEEYLDALSTCLRLQGVANAGSDMHVQLAARYDAACTAHAARYPGPPGRQLADDAAQRLERALVARYGATARAAVAAADGTMAASGSAAPRLQDLVQVARRLHRQQTLM
ncbi:hypothetical protein GPECTOR_26g546 [Gonium pectorale]|uniref:SET domain-containing protein n=1 Tax=Gonium pectorale TaxID=33097 RepID=A0A150GFT3_GONPE|nr:hypothetical protein GPECTOR_26g546 [Gonium pectorale]|eukprot:KXZ48643.1 hypothetical protein GPECTOR_26g546 [Gonium pectorale]